jgi:hypothetical protein
MLVGISFVPPGTFILTVGGMADRDLGTRRQAGAQVDSAAGLQWRTRF